MKNLATNTTILRYILWRILPFVVPVLLGVFILTYEFTYRTIEDQQYTTIENELSFAHNTLENRLIAIRRWVKSLSENGMVINALADPKGTGEHIPQLFHMLRAPGPQNKGRIEFLNFHGEILASNQETIAHNINKDWLLGVLLGERYESITYQGLIIAEPVKINGSPEGVVVLFFDLPELSEFLEISFAGGYMSVLDKNNRILFSSLEKNHFKAGDVYNEEKLADWVTSKTLLSGSSGLFVVFKQKADIAFQAVRDVQYALIVFIIISLLGILVSVFISGRIVRKALSGVGQQMQDLRTAKDLSKRIELSPIHELSELEQAYNDMASELQDTTVSKDYIDTLFEALPLPVFVVNKSGHITRVNAPALASFQNINLNEELLFQNIIDREDLEAEVQNLTNHFGYESENAADAFFYLSRKYGTHETEVRLNRGGGLITPYILSITSQRNTDGKISGYIIAATDIDDRKQKEREILDLAEQNMLMAKSIEEIDLGITISDGTQAHQPLIFCNQAFKSMSGRSRNQIIGKSCNFMQGPDTDPEAVEQIRQAIANRESITVEILNYRKNGESFWNELSLNPILSSDGSLKNYVGIQSDISERKRVEEIKQEFVSTVSHELRTPLTSIHGSLGLINEMYDGQEDSEEKNLLAVAYRNSGRLKFLVDDILDTEKLDSGEMSFNMELCKLSDVLEQGVFLNVPYGEEYGVRFDLAKDVPDIELKVDQHRMIQVFANLLSNAAKFSNGSDHVDIRADLVNGSSKVRISVTDYGDGISEDFQEQIFTKFAQQDSSDARKLPGTGLGLYITKRIIEAHDGIIDFKTEAGKGTTFFMDMPY